MKGDRNQDEVSMTKERTNALFISCAKLFWCVPYSYALSTRVKWASLVSNQGPQSYQDCALTN